MNTNAPASSPEKNAADIKNLALDYYHCTFFLPLGNLEDHGLQVQTAPYIWGSANDDNQREMEYQALRFFSPVLRDLLFDTGEKVEMAQMRPIREWRVDESRLQNAFIILEKENEQPPYQAKARLVAVQLYRYFNGQYLLAYRVEPDTNQPMKLDHWLRFTGHARLLYSSFTEQEQENKQSEQKLFLDGKLVNVAFNQGSRMRCLYPNEEVSHVVRGLLNCFVKDNKGINQFFENTWEIHDDRMFVSVAYGLRDSLPVETLEAVGSLAGWVDQAPDNGNYLYDQETIRGMMHNSSFTLWRHQGGFYVFSDMANAYVYSQSVYFNNTIAPKHIPYEYDRMLIQALFYQASLRHYDYRICQETDNIIRRIDLNKTREWRAEFIRFTNQYWFHQLTEQMQGKEIFRLQQQALGLREHYEIIKDELERTDEFLQAEHESRMARFSEKLGFWGLVVALLALYYSLLPLFSEVFTVKHGDSVISMWQRVGSWCGCADRAAQACGLSALVLGGTLFLVAIIWGGRKVMRIAKPQPPKEN